MKVTLMGGWDGVNVKLDFCCILKAALSDLITSRSEMGLKSKFTLKSPNLVTIYSDQVSKGLVLSFWENKIIYLFHEVT